MDAPRRRRAPSARRDSLGAKRDRLRIAQVAARLIAEHGLTDWTLAKRKAVRQLLLPDSTALPSNDEIEAALTDHHALFGGDAHVAALRRQRVEALSWMRRLAAWDPVLVGGVAAGWATEHSDVRLELAADDPKAVEIELAGHGVSLRGAAARARAMRRRCFASNRTGWRSGSRSSRRSSGATGRARPTSRGSPPTPLATLVAAGNSA